MLVQVTRFTLVHDGVEHPAGSIVKLPDALAKRLIAESSGELMPVEEAVEVADDGKEEVEEAVEVADDGKSKGFPKVDPKKTVKK